MEDYKKKYEDALKRAEAMIEVAANREEVMNCVSTIFPEELNEDERVRKELIEHIKANEEVGFILFQKFSPAQILAYLEKVKDFDKQLDEAYQTANAVVYKKGYDDGYLEGITNAKKELEKQGEMDIEMDIEKPITIGKRQLTGKAAELAKEVTPESLAEAYRELMGID